ncbi:hypothetical protein CDD80_3062 [Ophiocordyceps camponoti-rufipedis]|uniref:TspO/MBR-related protein n=1 Tax=Ophiocordyceps camponoti-rufipedis TaxID=2004952 RepID=A0A2C5Z453_9HYPO|nr:hypothetical protein CDD80_3062 [Ophiocordyceps camponoti-rufipedis]
MPSITIPAAVLQHPAASVLLPVALGTAVGFGTRPAAAASALGLWSRLDVALRVGCVILEDPSSHRLKLVVLPHRSRIMGYASYRVATIGLGPLASPETVRVTRQSLTLYTVQLGLNLAWMPLFFVAKRPVEATIDIVTLLGLNGYLAYLWHSVDHVAGLCQVPYLGWLSFATYLCAGAGYLNNWDLSDKTARVADKEK